MWTDPFLPCPHCRVYFAGVVVPFDLSIGFFILLILLQAAIQCCLLHGMSLHLVAGCIKSQGLVHLIVRLHIGRFAVLIAGQSLPGRNSVSEIIFVSVGVKVKLSISRVVRHHDLISAGLADIGHTCACNSQPTQAPCNPLPFPTSVPVWSHFSSPCIHPYRWRSFLDNLFHTVLHAVSAIQSTVYDTKLATMKVSWWQPHMIRHPPRRA